jgi:hypothetical protein
VAELCKQPIDDKLAERISTHPERGFRMNQDFHHHHEVVTRLIRHCHQNKAAAVKIYEQVVVGRQKVVELPDGAVSLTQDQLDKFVERFSSEVGPEIWESKSGKY